jgi:hypothetical protein
MNCFGEVQENRSHEGVQQLREEHDAQKASKKKGTDLATYGSVDNIINCSLVGSTTLQNCALHNGIGLPIGYPLVI